VLLSFKVYITDQFIFHIFKLQENRNQVPFVGSCLVAAYIDSFMNIYPGNECKQCIKSHPQRAI
jgi:hypothetical protein